MDSVGRHHGKNVIGIVRANKEAYRHLVCDCGNYESFSLNIVPVERHSHPGHKLRRQAVCNNYCGRRQIIGYGSILLWD